MAQDPRRVDVSLLTHLADLTRSAIPRVHPAGWPFVAGGLSLTALGLKWRTPRLLGLGFAAASAAFFRNPQRTPPIRDGVVVAPADGVVALVDEAAPPAELGLGEDPWPRVSVFLSLLNAHVQRAPAAGTVVRVEHVAGRFLPADLKDASRVNERMSVLIDTDAGSPLVVVQIAGLIARRIVCDAVPGQRLGLGETYGLIRFGSRVDTYLPRGTAVDVAVGQHTLAGETLIGVLR